MGKRVQNVYPLKTFELILYYGEEYRIYDANIHLTSKLSPFVDQ